MQKTVNAIIKDKLRAFARSNRIESGEARALLSRDRLSRGDLGRIVSLGLAGQMVEREVTAIFSTLMVLALIFCLFPFVAFPAFFASFLLLRTASALANHLLARATARALREGAPIARHLRNLTIGVGVAGFLWGAMLWPFPGVAEIDPTTFLLVLIALIAVCMLAVTTAQHRPTLLAALFGNALAIAPKILNESSSLGYPALTAYMSFLAVLFFFGRRIESQARRMVILQLRNRRMARRLEIANRSLGRALIKAEDLAHRDVLTGLSNRRAFVRDLSRLRQSKMDHWLLLLDIDHFKLINDSFGHDMGDGVLAAVGRTLGWWESENAGRLAARWGGEEFIVLIERSQAASPAEDIEKLRDLFADLSVNLPWPGDLKLSVSIGCVELEDGTDTDEAIGRADAALYQAKRSGRDCWRMAA